MSDRLHDTLSTLRSDVDSMPLADSSAVRARGTQRTRRQAVGISLAVVALVAGAVGISGALTGTNKASELPADDQTVTTTQEPSPDPTAETRLLIGTESLLTVEELPEVPNQTFTEGETLENMTGAEVEEQNLTVCQKPPFGGQNDESNVVRFFPSDLDAFAWHWVAQYENPKIARKAFDDLWAGCESKSGTETEILGSAQAQMTFRATTFSADQEYFGELQGVALRGDVVVVLTVRGMLQEGDVDLADFDAALDTAAERVSSG